MNIFRRVAEKTVDAVKEVSTESAGEKLDIAGDLAKIGIFLLMCYGTFKGVSTGKPISPKKPADFSQLIINNYYYGDEKKGNK